MDNEGGAFMVGFGLALLAGIIFFTQQCGVNPTMVTHCTTLCESSEGMSYLYLDGDCSCKDGAFYSVRPSDAE